MVFSFKPREPYPLLPFEAAVHPDAREHARQVDSYLGFDISAAEKIVATQICSDALSAHETWAHVDPQIFLTPYLELRLIADLLKPVSGSTFVDLGAGYCRMAFVLATHYPSVQFVGIECVQTRVTEAQRVFKQQGLKNSSAICADLLNDDFHLPLADVYFVYDFGSRADIALLLEKLRILRVHGAKKFKLVARGQRTRECIESAHRAWLFKEAPIWEVSEFAIYGT